MNYLETLRTEAEKKLRPLAAKVATLEKQLAVLVKRAAGENEDHAKAVDDLARWKALAGEYLADGSGTYDRYKTRLKAALLRVETSAETVKILAGELVPAKKAELDAARLALSAAANRFYAAAVPPVEARLTALLDQVVAEYDGFTAAFAQLRMDYGTNFNGELPHAAHVRILGTDQWGTGVVKWLTFKPAPPISAPAAPAPAPAPAPAATSPAAGVSACPGRAETAPTPEVGESVKGDTPRGETLAPEHEQDSPGPLGADAARARVLLQPPGAGDVPQEAPADLDPDPLPLDVDAEVEAELDTEAPPDAGEKENLGIVAEGT